MITFIAAVIVSYHFLIYVMHVGVHDGCLFIFWGLFVFVFLFLGVYVLIS